MPALRPCVGERFGRLVVIRPIRETGKKLQYLCQCDCGKEHTTRAEYLHRGEIRSCGCLRSEAAKRINAKRWADHEYSTNPRAVRRRAQRAAEQERLQLERPAPRQDSVRTMQWPPRAA